MQPKSAFLILVCGFRVASELGLPDSQQGYLLQAAFDGFLNFSGHQKVQSLSPSRLDLNRLIVTDFLHNSSITR